MKLSITAITTRKTRKPIMLALRNLDSMINDFEESNIECEYKSAMVTLMDQQEGSFEKYPNEDRCYHVGVGYGDDYSIKKCEPEELITKLGNLVLDAILTCKFVDPSRSTVESFVQKWRRK